MSYVDGGGSDLGSLLHECIESFSMVTTLMNHGEI